MLSRLGIRTLLAAAATLAIHLGAGGAAAEETRWFRPGEKVYIRQHEQFFAVQEPHVHMKLARRAFEKGLNSVAADEIERAAVGFAYFAQRGAGQDRKQLEASSQALGDLASEVRKGDVDGVGQLDLVFKDARRVLAGESLKEPAAAGAPAAPSAPSEPAPAPN